MKITIYGSMDNSHTILGGQHDRTEIIVDCLKKKLSKNTIIFFNIFYCKNNMFKLLGGLLINYFKSQKIIYIASTKGILAMTLIFGLLNTVLKKDLYCVVIGNFPVSNIISHKLTFRIFKNIKCSYYETETLRKEFELAGCHNTLYLPNCKKINLVKLPDIDSLDTPYKFCTYSRVTKTKGILDAIEAVQYVNRTNGSTRCTLDIYGNVDIDFRDLLTAAIGDDKSIKICGSIKRKNSTDTLKSYIALLFPTHHKGEGVPGGIIDSYQAGLPIIATDICFNKELIKHNKTGLVYKEDDRDALCKILKAVTDDPTSILKMRKDCLLEVMQYDLDFNINRFIQSLELC